MNTVSSVASSVSSASKLDTALAEMITKATTGVEAGVNFLSAQLPDVIHQLLVWKIVENSYIALLCLVPIVFFCYALNKSIKLVNSDKWDITAGISGFISAFACCGLIVSVKEILYIWIAPKVWLIQYAADLLK